MLTGVGERGEEGVHLTYPPQKNSIDLVIKHQNRGLGFSHNPKHPLQKNLKITEHLAIQIFKLKR